MKMKKHETESDRKRAERYIESVRWQFAKTMPLTPHEYTLKKWKAELAGEFEWLVVEIREYGYQATFKGRRYVYLKVGAFAYWTMGAPVADTILINRAAVNVVPDKTRGNSAVP